MTNYNDNNDAVKIILVGNSKVGKSTLFRCLIGKNFSPSYEPTIAVDFGVLKRDSNLFLWDLSGDKRFQSLTEIYYRSISIVIYTFDRFD